LGKKKALLDDGGRRLGVKEIELGFPSSSFFLNFPPLFVCVLAYL